MRQTFTICVVFFFFFSCSEKKEANKIDFEEVQPLNLPGNALAVMQCGRCHAFVNPELLPKSSWKNDVLPYMGHRLGIYTGEHQPDSLFDPGIGGTIIRKSNAYPEKPVIAREDWNKIVNYYVENAPDTIMPPIRNKQITMGLKQFRYKETKFSNRPPLTLMVKILPDKQGVVFSDAKPFDNNIFGLNFLTSDLEFDYALPFNTIPVHYHEESDTIFLATIGTKMFPHDAPMGTLQKVYNVGPNPADKTADIIIPNLQRPVFMAYGDLNNDGLEDVVACEYGNVTGKLVWFENMGGDTYSMRPLRGQPGAISAVIKDVNSDGFLDIIVLMAQGDEGVFLYENRGNGTFTEKRLLSFLPLYGSQYIELADFNKDGFDDLLYVCGDNADKTPFLKSFHGIYIFLNDGSYNFNQSYFYQLNGAYKAIPRDYDLDGDLDIAAISFFPDYLSYPEESFVYLENKGDLVFDDYSFPEATKGRWIVMDAGDMDADGDIDLALGSFVYFEAMGDTTGLGEKWMTTGPSVVVLENTTR